MWKSGNRRKDEICSVAIIPKSYFFLSQQSFLKPKPYTEPRITPALFGRPGVFYFCRANNGLESVANRITAEFGIFDPVLRTRKHIVAHIGIICRKIDMVLFKDL